MTMFRLPRKIWVVVVVGVVWQAVKDPRQAVEPLPKAVEVAIWRPIDIYQEI
jgi:hypothetical protein